jgi:hypothetical protein
MTKRLTRFLRRNTIALIALFFALSGTTFAAANALAPNSVGARQLKKNAVTAPKIKNGNVTNAKLARGAVTGVKVKDASITGADVLETSLAKVPSATAADTAAALTGITVRRFAAGVLPDGAQATALDLNGLLITLTCAGGNVALRANNNSGGFAQFRYDAHYGAGTTADGGAANFTSSTNSNLNANQNAGSGSAHFIKVNGSATTAVYGWRSDSLGGTIACRVFGFGTAG